MCSANRHGVYTSCCGAKKTKVRILLDTGSQISLIREGSIPQSDTCHMQDLTTVRGDTVHHKRCVVECTLESLDGIFNREVRNKLFLYEGV